MLGAWVNLASETIKTGVKGKATKIKSSQKTKNKTKVKVVLQQPPQQPAVSDGAASAAMKECMVKMCSPTPSELWVIPRDFAVESCPINYESSINIDSATGTGVVIDCKPDLHETIRVFQEKAPLTISVTGRTRNQAYPVGAVNSLNWNFHLHWYDATGAEVDVASWLVSDPAHISWDDSRSRWIEGYRRVYAFQPSAIGNQVFSYSNPGAVPVNIVYNVATYNLTLNQTSIDTVTIPLPPGTQGSNVVGGLATTDPLVSTFFTLPANFFSLAGTATFGLGAITLLEIQTSSFNPAPGLNNSLYQTVLSTSSKYSFPILDVLGTFTGSDLLNGGNLAVGIVPYDYPISRIPAIAYAEIAALGGRRYTGPMKNGFHGFYIPDDITRVAFFDMDQEIHGRRIVAAVIPQTISGGGPSSSVSIRLRVRSHLEFINPSQTLPHMTSVFGMTQEFEALLASMGSSDTQVGENPDHIARVKNAITRAAKDPRVIEAGKRALSVLGKAAAISIPILLGVM